MSILDASKSPKAVITALHKSVTRDLIRLLDGFYSNIEDGLFEHAYQTNDESQRARYFDLMREMRMRRSSLVKGFARGMDRNLKGWFDPDRAAVLGSVPVPELDAIVTGMIKNSNAHFGGVLEVIAQRTEHALNLRCTDVPISPRHIAGAFVNSCRTLKLDTQAIEIVQDLFRRFVLDGLGSIYGEFNHALMDEGFHTSSEMGMASSDAS